METTKQWCPFCNKEQAFELVEGDKRIVARWSAHVVARESAHVVARESAYVEARGSAHVVAQSPYVMIVVKEPTVTAKGRIIGSHKIKARQWLQLCGVPIRKGKVILYKSVSKNFQTRNNVSFVPETQHKAPDWDSTYLKECGCGIHYCPSVAQAKEFRDENTYVACEVNVSDIADLPAFAQYPDKIRARGGFTLYQCDEKGNKLKEENHG